jgi:hypothetical protein
MEGLMIFREQKIMTFNVHGCTNALKDRMSDRGHPEHCRSLPSMAPRHTVHPEHKKADNIVGFII